jgi:hypothetical protein
MLDDEIEAIIGWQSRVFKPKSVDKALDTNIIPLALDTEYKLPFLFPEPEAFEQKYGYPYPKQYEDNFQPKKPFLTFQLAAKLPNDDIVADGFKADHQPSRREFLHWVYSCLDKWGISWRGKRVVIGSHSSRMELQHIHPLPPIREWGSNSWECLLARNVTVIDTLKLFGGSSLSTIAKSTPIPKHSLDGFKEKPEAYWRANPDALYEEAEEEFWKYALTDVRALLWSMLELRKFVWERWHVDLFKSRSIAGLSVRILETKLSEALEPAIRQPYLDRKGQPRTRLIFNPELIEARRTSLKAYQGGRREAYTQGRIEEPVYCYDFSKQYTVAALSIPLPTQSTKLEHIQSVEDCCQRIGWARIHFSFPKGLSPCIGVKDLRFPKLTFPREGECWTGVFSIRRALEKGAQVEVLDGYGFTPTEKELNHPIHAYFRQLLDIGNEHKDKFLEKFAKGLANTLVGRFIGKYDIEDEDDVEDRLARGWRTKLKQVMGSFAPMHACLILDQARALEDHLIDLSKSPAYTHTDSVYTRDPIDLSDSFVEWIRGMGGDVKLEMVSPNCWILRSAVGYFANPEPYGNPKCPHHAFHTKESDYAKVIETMLKYPELKPDGFAKIDYTTLREHVTKKHPIASYKIRGTRPKYVWDYKRRLLGEPLKGSALWTEHVETEPWQSVEELIEHYSVGKQSLSKRFRALRGKPGRPSTVASDKIAKIHDMREGGVSVKSIAKQLEISPWAVYRVLRKSNHGLPHSGISPITFPSSSSASNS